MFETIAWFGAALSAAIVAGAADLAPLWAAMLMWPTAGSDPTGRP